VSSNGHVLLSECIVDELVPSLPCQRRIPRNGDKSPTELFPTPVGPMTLLENRDEYNDTTRHETAYAMMMSSLKKSRPVRVGKLRAAGLSLLWIGVIVVCAWLLQSCASTAIGSDNSDDDFGTWTWSSGILMARSIHLE
jgi:hypothetical protein